MLRLHRTVIAAGLGVALAVTTLVDPALAAPRSTQTLTSSYTVVNGDYLTGIAIKLNVKVSDLLVTNHLQLTSLILPGMRLAVPARIATAANPRTASAATAARYTVVNGDYLTGIATTLGVSIRELLTVNGLSLNSLIYPGMQLRVPKGARLSAPTTVATKTTSVASSATGTYTVVAGDSLSGIAARLGITLQSLLATNQLSAGSLIYPGMHLKAPRGAKLVAAPISKPAAPAKVLRYTVVNGDFLAGIAQQLGVTLPSLLSTNKITASSVILPGMQLIVPKGGVLSPSAIAAAAPISPTVAKVLAYARAQLGKPYKFNTAGPNTFDCSGLVLAAFARIGMTLPHYSGAQMSFGKVIDWTTEAIRPGDLVFYESAPGSGVVDHVGIATSATTWIQAPRSGDVVREGHFGMTRVIGVRRLIGQ